ncbi:MAG: aspartate/glutamate racemase family protein [Litorilinea sp.]
MTQTLTFLHTAPSNVEPFTRLAAELAPHVQVRHIVDESLLNDARAQGVTPELQARVDAQVQTALDAGADLVLCTCSSIGGCAEISATHQSRPVLRVDRAMARAAVEQGERILVFATLASTLAPTKALILDEAQRAGKSVTLTDVICDAAWARLEAGDQEGYLDEVAAALQRHAGEGDVLVLAQASMAQAAARAGELPVPVLTSPSLGLHDALARLAV